MKTHSTRSIAALLVTLVAVAGAVFALSLPADVGAYSAKYNDKYTGTLRTVPTGTQSTVWSTVLSGKICNYCHYGRLYMNNPSINVQYGCQIVDADTGVVIPNGGTVSKGTNVRLRFMPHDSADIYWFATGSFVSSPYGDWITSQKLGAGATVDKVPAEAAPAYEQLCTMKNRVFNKHKAGGGDGGAVFASLSLNAPVKSINLPSGANCTPVAPSGGSPATSQIGYINGGGYDCTLNEVGTFDPTFRFAMTQGHFYTTKGERDGSSCGTSKNRSTDGAARGVSNSASLSLPGSSVTVTYDGNTYTAKIPAQTIALDAEYITIPAQTFTPPTKLSRKISRWVSGSTEGASVDFPGGNLAVDLLGNNVYVGAQAIGGFSIAPATFTARETDGGRLSTVTVPSRTCSYSLTVVDGPTPSEPTISGDGSCTVGQPYTIAFVATNSDPNEGVKYHIDWDSDGLADDTVPDSGFVSSGSQRSAARTHNSADDYTVVVTAENESGGKASASFSYSCADPYVPETDNGGPDDEPEAGGQCVSMAAGLNPSRRIIRAGETVTLNWCDEGSSCVITGGTLNEVRPNSGSLTTPPLFQETTYTIECRNDDGPTTTYSETIRVLPRIQET